MKNAGRLGVAATMVMGVILGVLLVSLAGPISRLLVREDAIIGGIAIAPAIAALLWLAAAATVFDGLQATASFALRAQGMVWLPSAIHLSSFFVVMIPVCYWLAIPLGRGAAGCWKGRLSASSWPGRRSSSCWNGKRRAPVWNAPPDPDRSPWGSEQQMSFRADAGLKARGFLGDLDGFFGCRVAAFARAFRVLAESAKAGNSKPSNT